MITKQEDEFNNFLIDVYVESKKVDPKKFDYIDNLSGNESDLIRYPSLDENN